MGIMHFGSYKTMGEQERMNELTDATRKLIDEMTYEEMLRKHRFEPSGSPWFLGEVGDYFGLVMYQKKNELDPSLAAEISERVGWKP